MKVIIVLLGTFLGALLVTRLMGQVNYGLSGRIALAVMLLFAALGHVLYTQGMVMMIPDFLPLRKEAVYLTGILEVAAAVCLLVPGWHTATGWLLIAFFVLMLPANIYGAMQHVNLEKATYDGPGLSYLWFRVPEQVLFIGWAYFFAVR